MLLPVLKTLVKSDGDIIALIKPQFECGKNSLGKSGILLDKKKMLEVLKDNTTAFNNFQTTLSEVKTTIQLSMERKS